MSLCLDCFGGVREGEPIWETEAFHRFLEHARAMWGEKTIASLNISLNHEERFAKILEKDDVFAALVFRRDPPPRAMVGGGKGLLIRAAPERLYSLVLAPKLLSQDDDTIAKVLIHEAGHIGFANHGEDFNKLVLAQGGVVSGSALEEGYKIKIERKDPGERRYKVVREFDDAATATAWAKDQIRSKAFPNSRWRIVQ